MITYFFKLIHSFYTFILQCMRLMHRFYEVYYVLRLGVLFVRSLISLFNRV